MAGMAITEVQKQLLVSILANDSHNYVYVPEPEPKLDLELMAREFNNSIDVKEYSWSDEKITHKSGSNHFPKGGPNKRKRKK